MVKCLAEHKDSQRLDDTGIEIKSWGGSRGAPQGAGALRGEVRALGEVGTTTLLQEEEAMLIALTPMCGLPQLWVGRSDSRISVGGMPLGRSRLLWVSAGYIQNVKVGPEQ